MSDDFYYRPPAGPKRPPRPRTRELSEAAQGRLTAMASELPAAGEHITIRWPGGPHDFEMVFEREGDPCPFPGWRYLYGVIVLPQRWHPRRWSPMAHLVDGEWSMLPMGGKVSDVEP